MLDDDCFWRREVEKGWVAGTFRGGKRGIEVKKGRRKWAAAPVGKWSARSSVRRVKRAGHFGESRRDWSSVQNWAAAAGAAACRIVATVVRRRGAVGGRGRRRSEELALAGQLLRRALALRRRLVDGLQRRALAGRGRHGRSERCGDGGCLRGDMHDIDASGGGVGRASSSPSNGCCPIAWDVGARGAASLRRPDPSPLPSSSTPRAWMGWALG